MVRILNDSATKNVFKLESHVDFENAADDKGVPKVKFQGYSGAPVNLSSYGFDHPVAYDLSGLKTPRNVPILYKHYDEIGHTTGITNDGKTLAGEGMLSVPGSSQKKVREGINNEFPWQGSMGLSVPNIQTSLKFYKNGTTVNGRNITHPLYVFHDSVLNEMTVTPFGRDSDTSFQALNEEQLMLIQNADDQAPADDKPVVTPTDDKKIVNSDDKKETPADNKPKNTPPTDDKKIVNSDDKPADPPKDNPRRYSLGETIKLGRLIERHPQYEEMIENSAEKGVPYDEIEQQVAYAEYKNSLPTPPRNSGGGGGTHHAEFEARVMLSYGVAIETISAKYGEKIADKIDNMGEMLPAEQLLHVARMEGGRYTGHSDVENMCTFLKNSGFSTYDFPNLLKRVADTMLEERWKLQAPFATRFLAEESNKDFRKTEKRRITGGEMWRNVEDDGKLQSVATGKDQYYETDLDTVGGYFQMTRQDIINDDQGVLRQLMEAMVEGAYMVPDVQLGRLMMEDPSSTGFFVTGVNSFYGTALTRANLKAKWTAVRQYSDQRGDINWNTILDDRWKVITSIYEEETAFDILQQNRIVNDTTANTKTGDKNFMYNKLDQLTYPHMASAVMGDSNFVHTGTWFLWPTNKKYSPYVIVFLRGRKKPVIESMNLPGDILGRGMRGYWDVKVNRREKQFIVRCTSNSAP